MKCFVTGASGFIGANLVHELVARGYQVRALTRPNSDTRGLSGVPYERVEGDIANVPALKTAMAGCSWCFHVAASYHLWLRDYREMYATNVEGTRNVLQAAAKAGCQRIVHTSTVGCIAVPQNGNGQTVPTDETTSVTERNLTTHYKRSKWRAEQVALGLARQGLPIIIVNPSAPIGPRDVRPTPTGKVILDFLNRKMPAYLDTGLNWVHVRDVAVGHILAAERGRTGERYILGNAHGNWTMQQAFAQLTKVAQVPAPSMRLPYLAALAFAFLSNTLAGFTGKTPRAPLGAVRMAKHKMFFNPAKAIRELGLPQTSLEVAMADSVRWFRDNGYVNSRT